ncbi:MAG TPA: O-antigen ligase family protein [Candidatus Dormibacteraeota bacterium]|jgi:O-antigen ligase|nr:O-antigen ligase family protein [Candidatus Dormibacteraeota bacterium]
MNREAWDNFFERGILALVLAILVFGPLAMGAVGAWELLVVQGLTVGVMLLWALRLWISPKPQLLWPPVCWVVLAFTIYAVARYLTADIEYVARQELIQVLICAFLFFAIVNNLYRQEFSQIISFTLIFLAMGISCFAVYQFFTHSNRVWNSFSPYLGRASGTYISPNNFAGFLEMLLPLAVAYMSVGRMKAVTRILIGYAALVMFAGMAVSFSRGGWVAVGVALLALLLILICHRNHLIPALLLLVVLMGGGAFFVKNFLAKTPTYIQRVEKTDTSDQLDLAVRRDMWVAAARMWQDHFWWGVGPAHFDYRFPEYRPESLQMRPDRVHNDYLNLLADWGVTGGIIVLAGMAVFALGLWQTRGHVRRSENHFGSAMSNRHAFFLGAACGLLALAVHSLVDFNLHIPANAILGVTLLALLSSNLRFATENYWLNIRLPLKLLVTFPLALGIAYLGWQEWRHGNEVVWLVRAERLPIYSPEQAVALEKAFASEPLNFETAYNIGECYRIESFDGGEDYEVLAHRAMDRYSYAMELDPHDGYNYLRYGMCLDWLDDHDKAGAFFNRAAELDPNGYYAAANIGWHYAQAGNYAAAYPWLERSIRLHWQGNDIARNYLDLVRQKLLEIALDKGS